jgi:hypothetical protein
MTLSDSQIRQAEKRMKARMAATARATSARFDRRRSRIVVSLDNGLELAFPPNMAEGLAGAKPADLAIIEISPTGLGVHWPRLDADLYLPALMNGVFGSRRWMAGLLGAAGGKSTSPAKRSAAQANGRLGGRPRKAVAA